MKANVPLRLALSAPFLSALPLAAQMPPAQMLAKLHLEPVRKPSLNRISLAYRPGFNISAKFKGLGGFALPGNAGPPTGGDVDRIYDDGYNLRDTTTGDGLTWNWGYKRGDATDPASGYGSQVSPDGSLLFLSRSTSEANGSTVSFDGEPYNGVELSFQRQLLTTHYFRAGLEAALNFNQINIRSGRSISGDVHQVQDFYSLNGIVPPQAAPPDWAYRGTFYGPGPLIGDKPTRVVDGIVPTKAATVGHRKLEASVYGLRLGPYLEAPIGRRLNVSVSAGLAAAVVDSHFEFSETTTIPGVESAAVSAGQDESTDVRYGVFVAGSLAYNLTPSVDLFGGLQYQNLNTFRQSVGGKTAELRFDQSIFATLGIGYSF